MSLPDNLLDEDERYCVCGNELRDWQLYCSECTAENTDIWVDEAIKENRKRWW